MKFTRIENKSNSWNEIANCRKNMIRITSEENSSFDEPMNDLYLKITKYKYISLKFMYSRFYMFSGKRMYIDTS